MAISKIEQPLTENRFGNKESVKQEAYLRGCFGKSKRPRKIFRVLERLKSHPKWLTDILPGAI